MRSINLFFSFIYILIAALAAPAGAQWLENGLLMADDPESQVNPVCCSDGEGGTIVAWQDTRDGVQKDIYAQRLDGYGRPQWRPGGVAVCEYPLNQSHPLIESDGQGGALVAWFDERNGNNDVYAQRLDPEGHQVWDGNGKRVYTTYSDWVDWYALAADGQGGALIAWTDFHEVEDVPKVYAQRLLGADGRTLWGGDGLEMSQYAGAQESPGIVATGNGGAMVVWEEERGADRNVYAQWVKPDGTWTWFSGYDVCTATGDQRYPVVCSDGRGGFIAAWYDERSGIDEDLRAAGFDTSLVYTMNDLAICTATGDPGYIAVAPDGDGGAYFGWVDERSGLDPSVYAQRVDNGGNVQWATDGIPVCVADGNRSYLVMTADEGVGAILAWSDGRAAGGNQIYAHRLEPGGVGDWTTDGVLLCSAPGPRYFGDIAPDGRNGAVVVWYDARDYGNFDVYAQRIERNGYWGYPSPLNTSVADVPFDQGGRVTVTWGAPGIDAWPEQVVTHYSVWRRLGEAQLARLVADGVPGVELTDVKPDFTGPAFVLGDGKRSEAWEWLANQPAHWLEQYAYTAATLNDSLAGNPGWHHFFVSTHTADSFVFWDAPPDSGYSVDNLAPTAPRDLAGQAVYEPLGLTLTWTANEEADLYGYRIYRGDNPDFHPGAGNLLASVVDPVVLDDQWGQGSGYHYKVTALDVHGNESPTALLSPDGVSSTDEAPSILRPYLTSHPNPFNPMTNLRYALAEPADVTLKIIDARGREVAVLRQGPQTAGRHTVRWEGRDGHGRTLASGVYFCKLEAGSLRLVSKLMLVR